MSDDPDATPTTPAAPAAPAAPEQAHVHVVRGTPDDVELAALVAGLAAVSVADDGDPEHAPRSAWSDRSRSLRGPRTAPPPGRDSWRWSLRG